MTQTDYKDLDTLFSKATKEKQVRARVTRAPSATRSTHTHTRALPVRPKTFERLVVTKEEALELFRYNAFKAAIIQSKIPEGGHTTVYRNGDLIDLCR